ncbi:MAG: alcohol dehydrogenase catalytic domain-containing protein [Sphingomonadaceae bacterium]
MRAAVFQGRGKPHKVENVAEPVPAPREVIVKVDRCGICGSDLTMTAPRDGDSQMSPDVERLFSPGAILGHEFSGTVVALGKDVERLKVGDRVAPMFLSGCGHCVGCLSGKPNWCQGAYGKMGGYAQYATAHEQFSVRLPTVLTDDQGALIEPMATSLHAVTLAQVRPGARILVIGAGPIGLGIVYFLRRLGAGPIVAVTRSRRRRDTMLAMGADHFLIQGDDLAAQADDLLGGPPEIVFDAAGVPGIINQAIACVEPTGLIVAAGMAQTPEPTHHAAAAMKEIRIQYVMSYELRDFELVCRYLIEPNSLLNRLASDWVELDVFPDAFERLRSKSALGKVIVRPWG